MMETKTPVIRRSSSGRRWKLESRRRGAGGWPRLCVLTAALVLCLAGHGAAAQERETDCESVACLARAVIETIPEGERIALVPFWWPVTDLPEHEAKSLYDDLYNAMSRASRATKKRHKLVKKDRVYDEMWEATKWEAAVSNYQKYVDQLRADVVVHCKDGGMSKGMLKLSCTATGVDVRSALAGDMPPSQALIRVEQRLFPYVYALTRLSNKLAVGARNFGRGPQRIPLTYIVDRDIGQRSALTEDIGKRIVDGIAGRFETFQHEQQSQDSFSEAIGRPTEDAVETLRGYELRGEFRWTDEKRELASLRVELREDGRPVAWARTRLKHDWLPHTVAGAMRYNAEARAMPSDSLHEETAAEAAINVARARVVARALNVDAPTFDVVTSEAEGIEALKTLAHGIPVDEQVEPLQYSTGEWHVRLKARVVTVGGPIRPDVEAALTKDKLKAGEKFRITLSASTTVHVGVFAWGADGGVVRFYPNAKDRDLIVPAGGPLSLPRDDDEYQDFWSVPLPGHQENHEAIIVVASVKPLDFQKLGSRVGYSGAETMSVAISAGNFLDALGKLDLSQATLLVLPYRVQK